MKVASHPARSCSAGIASSACYVRLHEASADRWEKLAAADGPALQFWFRQSPRPLVPYDDSGNVSALDPPLDVPGMVNLVVTPRGRLLS
jgi:hypothetical protein